MALQLFDLMDWLDDESNNPSYFGNDFGWGLHPRHIHHRQPLSLWNRLADRPLCRRDQCTNGQISPIGKDGFQVSMDVTQFKPSELQVKVVDNSVVVEGKHEEREDNHGFISRHFVRRYALPQNYEADKVSSTLSSDGVLTVSVPKPEVGEKKDERIIQIQQTGPARLNVKENPKDDQKENSKGDKKGSGDKK